MSSNIPPHANSCVSYGTYLPQGIYGARLLFFVSARTNKRHHQVLLVVDEGVWRDVEEVGVGAWWGHRSCSNKHTQYGWLTLYGCIPKWKIKTYGGRQRTANFASVRTRYACFGTIFQCGETPFIVINTNRCELCCSFLSLTLQLCNPKISPTVTIRCGCLLVERANFLARMGVCFRFQNLPLFVLCVRL